MRRTLLALFITAILGGSALAVRAADPDKPKSPDVAKKADFKAERAAFAKLQVKFHRTLADLIEAQFAEDTDEAKIENLSKAVDQLRKELQAKRPPFQGGPGMGRGMGPGPGMGRGPDRGPGPGMRRGPGGPDDEEPGMGPGMGRGPGRGPGPGMGNGRQGRGDGPGPGMRRGPGGPDDEESGMGPGMGRGPGRGPGPGMGNGRQGRGVGPGPRGGGGYIDRDQDDRYEEDQEQK